MFKKELEKILEDCLKDADSVEECPVCGKKTYYLYKGAHDGEQHISPDQSSCSSCGFFWSQDDELEEAERAKKYKKKLRKPEEVGEVTLKEVYEKYKHFDELVSQIPGIYKNKIEYAGHYTRAMMLKECWEAIKETLGVEEGKK